MITDDFEGVALPVSRLPVQHPDFRYSESRNIYSAKLAQELVGRVYSDNATESKKGEWRSQFLDVTAGRDAAGRRPLHVEVGCNAGHVVVEWAARDPEAAYMGVDWKFKPVFRAAEKAKKRGIGNLLLLRAHAERLPYMFADGEIDHLYLYFPDPWAKKSQLKNRFITPINFARLHPLVRPGGTFHIKTDHAGYFEWMVNALAETNRLWETTALSRDLHAGNTDAIKLTMPEVTLFERLFIKDGLPIHSLLLKRI